MLVDNFRDSSFYNFDLDDPTDTTYIAGFYFSLFDDFFDRHVMNIDAFDWLHRTGANPPDEPVPGDTVHERACAPVPLRGRLRARVPAPARVLRRPGRDTWINEGLADWAAIALTGYFDPAAPITDPTSTAAHQCFLGWTRGRDAGEPEPREGGPGELAHALG